MSNNYNLESDVSIFTLPVYLLLESEKNDINAALVYSLRAHKPLLTHITSNENCVMLELLSDTQSLYAACKCEYKSQFVRRSGVTPWVFST